MTDRLPARATYGFFEDLDRQLGSERAGARSSVVGRWPGEVSQAVGNASIKISGNIAKRKLVRAMTSMPALPRGLGGCEDSAEVGNQRLDSGLLFDRRVLLFKYRRNPVATIGHGVQIQRFINLIG
ncbi:MAG: hypothetical protein GY925_07225 [Actinomycetia bacterium]|nr:hypothetical protein [Actinomycetes bacterium]